MQIEAAVFMRKGHRGREAKKGFSEVQVGAEVAELRDGQSFKFLLGLAVENTLGEESRLASCLEGMAADLPQEVGSLPQGVLLLQYTLWIHPYAWDWTPFAFPSYFVITLSYDGLNYHAELYTYVPAEEGEELMALPFEVKGSRFEVMYPVAPTRRVTRAAIAREIKPLSVFPRR